MRDFGGSKRRELQLALPRAVLELKVCEMVLTGMAEGTGCPRGTVVASGCEHRGYTLPLELHRLV